MEYDRRPIDRESRATNLVSQRSKTGEGHRPRNPVLILTGNELLAKNVTMALHDYEGQMHSHQSYNDYLGALCELTVRKYLKMNNWWDVKGYERTLRMARRHNIGAIVEAVNVHIKAKFLLITSSKKC